ncbi:MAG: hypothetical protein LBS24_01815 [Clostridiales Family XIII bacterium]|nr:hypothetical protein [Clostridiales Family XIII bacterium]
MLIFKSFPACVAFTEMRKLFVTMGSFSEGFTSVTAGSAAAKEAGAQTQKTNRIAVATKNRFIARPPFRFIDCFQYTSLLLQQYYGGFKNALHRKKGGVRAAIRLRRDNKGENLTQNCYSPEAGGRVGGPASASVTNRVFLAILILAGFFKNGIDKAPLYGVKSIYQV